MNLYKGFNIEKTATRYSPCIWRSVPRGDRASQAADVESQLREILLISSPGAILLTAAIALFILTLPVWPYNRKDGYLMAIYGFVLLVAVTFLVLKGLV